MAITALPTAPQRTDDPTTFVTRADAWVASLNTWTTQANSLASDANDDAAAAAQSVIDAAEQVTLATAQANLASDYKTDAQSAASNAAATANVTKWISGTTYTEGDNVWSPINFLTYRRKSTGGGTTDPSSDSTNWESLIVTSEIVLIASAIANDSATIDFTGLDDTYYKYIVDFSAVRASIDSTSMLMQVQSGGSWATSGYLGRIAIGQASISANTSDNARVFDSSNVFSTTSNVLGKIDIINPSLSDRPTIIHAFTIPSYLYSFSFKTYQYNANAATTGVRFVMESGNIASGTFKLYGLKA